MTSHSRDLIKRLKLSGSILDVGGLNVNGSVKQQYPQTIALDMRDGRGVDIVAKADDIPFDDEYFDNVTCLDMLEHDATFWKSIPEMFRVLKTGGLFVLSVPTIGFHEHGYPDDYYRFTESAIRALFNVSYIEKFGNIILATGVKCEKK